MKICQWFFFFFFSVNAKSWSGRSGSEWGSYLGKVYESKELKLSWEIWHKCFQWESSLPVANGNHTWGVVISDQGMGQHTWVEVAPNNHSLLMVKSLSPLHSHYPKLTNHLLLFSLRRKVWEGKFQKTQFREPSVHYTVFWNFPSHTQQNSHKNYTYTELNK